MLNIICGKLLEIENISSGVCELTVFNNNLNIGFAVKTANNNFNLDLNSEIKLYIYTYYNQELGSVLYGFESKLAKKTFEIILSCSGIGPKIGLAVLSSLSPDEFIEAIISSNISVLNSVNGIGQKKAEQIILLLKSKVQKLISSNYFKDNNLNNNKIIYAKKLSDTLMALNYSQAEINRALEYTGSSLADKQVDFDYVLKTSLSFLAKKS